MIPRPEPRGYAGNLGLLCYFKYVNFFLDSIRQGLQQVGATTSMPVVEVLVPVGLSVRKTVCNQDLGTQAPTAPATSRPSAMSRITEAQSMTK